MHCFRTVRQGARDVMSDGSIFLDDCRLAAVEAIAAIPNKAGAFMPPSIGGKIHHHVYAQEMMSVPCASQIHVCMGPLTHVMIQQQQML